MMWRVTTAEHRRGRVTPENLEEARKLRELYEARKADLAERGVTSQQAFGHEYGIGNQAAVGFFLNGRTALSLKAAIGFANGLGCSVADFSPRLAELQKRYAEAGAPLLDAKAQGPLPEDVLELAHHLATYSEPSERASAVTAAWTGLDLYETRMKQRAKQGSAPKRAQGPDR